MESSSTKIRGVSVRISRKGEVRKFQARIQIDGYRYHLGNFDTFEEAVNAKQEKWEETYGHLGTA